MERQRFIWLSLVVFALAWLTCALSGCFRGGFEPRPSLDAGVQLLSQDAVGDVPVTEDAGAVDHLGVTDAAATDQSGIPFRLAFLSQPTSIVAGELFEPPVSVAVVDQNGDVTSSSALVTLELGIRPAGYAGAPLGTLSVAAVDGCSFRKKAPSACYLPERLQEGRDACASSCVCRREHHSWLPR